MSRRTLDHGASAVGRLSGPGVRHLIHARHHQALKRRLNEIYVKHTGRDYETIDNTLERDHFMTADQALEFGLIDKVITSREAMEARGAT